MLKANKDITIRYNGIEYQAKKGEVLNPGQIFGIKNSELVLTEQRLTGKHKGIEYYSVGATVEQYDKEPEAIKQGEKKEKSSPVASKKAKRKAKR